MQSNQYPRALDIARPFRSAGLPVIMGGFHISGCLSMLDGKAVELDACREMGVSMFAGEAEGRLDDVLRDAAENKLAPLYDYMNDLPEICGSPVPFLPKAFVSRTLGYSTSFDAGRGCPYQCSFCTIINVQGRKSRFRTVDDVENLVRLNAAQGIHKFFITDDNFARNKDWEAILDRLIDLRENHGIPLGLMIQVDTLCHKTKGFIEKAKRAGVTRVFIGLENVNPENLAGAKKRAEEDRRISQHAARLEGAGDHHHRRLHPRLSGRHAGNDPARHRDHPARVAARHRRVLLPDPLPGSEDHQRLWKNHIAMDPDLNNYDLEHVCAKHPKMSDREWQDIYREAWSLYFTPGHMRTLFRRAAATGVPMGSLLKILATFSQMVPVEGVHPIQGGLFRLKHPSELRPGRKPPHPLLFWAGFAWETFAKNAKLARTIFGLRLMRYLVERDPAAKDYMDQALQAASDDDEDTLDLLTKTTGSKAAVAHFKKVADQTHARAQA